MDGNRPKEPEENLVEASLLLDIYGEMLTERQRRFMRLHFDEDLSFSQIAREFRVSRQAVHDSVKHALKSLETFERALKLVEKSRVGNEPRQGESVSGRQLVERLTDLRDRVATQPIGQNSQWVVDELNALITLLQPESRTGESHV